MCHKLTGDFGVSRASGMIWGRPVLGVLDSAGFVGSLRKIILLVCDPLDRLEPRCVFSEVPYPTFVRVQR